MAAPVLDLYRSNRSEYSMPKAPRLVRVRQAKYLTVPGRGEPGGEAFTVALGVLYGVAYTIRMAQRQAGQDYKVCKLEGLWWGGDDGDFSRSAPSQWNWKLLIRMPDFVMPEHVNEAKATLKEKGRDPEVRDVELEEITEGTCVQMLHVGAYAREGDTIAAMKEFAREKGLEFCGRHHEIYVSDPSRVAEEKLKTILRMPVKRVKP